MTGVKVWRICFSSALRLGIVAQKRAALLSYGPLGSGVSEAYVEGLEVRMDKEDSVNWLRLAAAGGCKQAGAKLQKIQLH